MQKAKLNEETWTALAALLLLATISSPLQRHLVTSFIQDLEECASLEESMKTLSVGLTALLSVRGSASGEVRTTSTLDSASPRSS